MQTLFRLGAAAALSILAACQGPAVPHSLASTSDENCLKCHRDTGSAPATTHPKKKGCIDCHKAP